MKQENLKEFKKKIKNLSSEDLLDLTVKDRTEFEDMIVGKPIKNEDGRVIGKITGILWDKYMWIGEVYIQLKVENNATVSITCLKEKGGN